MAYGYNRYFGEIAVLRDLTTMPEEVRWRTTALADNDGRHPIVLYLGCNVFRTSHMIQTITEIFDKCKKCRLWQDPERVRAETTPGQRADNVDAARAREVVQDTFSPLPSARDAANSPPS